MNNHGYIFEYEGNQYTPEGRVSVPDVTAHNQAQDAEGLAIWATKPEVWVAYITDRHVTTWMETTIGVIIQRREFRNNWNVKMESVTVQGNNGEIYSGRRALDNDLVTLHRRKTNRKHIYRKH